MDSTELHLRDAEIVMSDAHFLARRAELDKLASLTAEFSQFWLPYRQKLAAFVTEHDGDVLLLSDMEEAFQLLASQMQKRIRLKFAKYYID